MLGLLAFIPGIGPIAAMASGAVTFLLRCTPCLIALAVGGAWIAGDIHGHRKSDAACAAADLRMQLAAQKRDADIAKDTAVKARADAEELRKTTDTLQSKVADYEQTLSKRPAGSCALTRDDIKRLRDIR